MNRKIMDSGIDAEGRGKRFALLYHESYLLHENSPTHPERRERLTYTMDQLHEEGVLDRPGTDVLEPEPATMRQLERVHERRYLDRLRNMSNQGTGSLSVDTHVNYGTWESAVLAAGGMIEAGEAVLAGPYDSSFCLSRPPGHHAFPADGHGFCFLNNTAVMIRHLQEEHDVSRVLVWDWDAHHGDGTQDVFYDDPSVLVLSTHQDGRTLFPGTGFVDETGEGKGTGYNVNVPLPPKTGDEAYRKVVEELFRPITRQFDPDLLFVEAGQDNHFSDPITNLGVTASGYTDLMDASVEAAEEMCEGRIVAGLSGGYGIEGGLPYTNLGVIAALSGMDTGHIREPEPYHPPDKSPGVDGVIDRVKQMHASHWKF